MAKPTSIAEIVLNNEGGIYDIQISAAISVLKLTFRLAQKV